jgi:hypothetical protein
MSMIFFEHSALRICTTGGIEFKVTNEELSQAANISPYTVSRLMSGWQSTDAISKHRGRIVLHSHKRLLLKPCDFSVDENCPSRLSPARLLRAPGNVASAQRQKQRSFSLGDD